MCLTCAGVLARLMFLGLLGNDVLGLLGHHVAEEGRAPMPQEPCVAEGLQGWAGRKAKFDPGYRYSLPGGDSVVVGWQAPVTHLQFICVRLPLGGVTMHMQSDFLALLEEDGESQEAEVHDGSAEVKARIRELLEEKRQGDDYVRRLQRKLVKLGSSLGEVVKEEESLRRKLDMEVNRKSKESQALRNELASKGKNQENRVREQLSHALYSKPLSTHVLHYDLDTVKVVFEPSPDPLVFRLGASTTVRRLCCYACKFWTVSPDKYVLKTMANCKCSDDVPVKSCFRQGELAQLRLEEKRLIAGPPSEEELKSITSKAKTRRGRAPNRRYNRVGVERVQKYVDSHAAQLRRFGGVYFLLKLQEGASSEHRSKIKLRDIFTYSLLLILSLFLYYSRRPGGQDFWLAQGVQNAFSEAGHRFPGLDAEHRRRDIPPFREVHQREEVWAWLKHTLPEVVWTDDPLGFGSYNMLVGYMAIRVKNVAGPADPAVTCRGLGAFTQRLGGDCYAVRAAGDAERRQDLLAVSDYWRAALQEDSSNPERIRGDADPGHWVSAAESSKRYGVERLTGLIDRYDGAGYSVHYKLDAPNTTKAKLDFAEDMDMLQQAGWISLRTRVAILSFTIYNFDYDMWVASDFLFEMVPSGLVKTYFSVVPFKPRLDETRKEIAQTGLDVVRLLISIYILVFVGMAERRHKVKYHKAGVWYHLSLNGITDYGIVACIWVAVLWRIVGFRGPAFEELLVEANDEFHSFSSLALAYNHIFAIEGLLVVFLALRLVSLMRLNYTIYLFWASLGRGFKSFIFFAFMFLPAICGLIIVLHTTYGPYMDEYSMIQLTAMQFYRIVQGNVDPERLLKFDSVMGISFLLFFFLMVSFLLVNIFAAIVVDAHYITQVTAGGPGEQWSWQRWYRWATPPLLVNMLQGMWASQQSRYVESV